MSTREERLEYARLLVRRHPMWGEPRLNLSIKNEYGVGLRRKDLAALKQGLVFDEGRFTPAGAIQPDNKIITLGFTEAQQMLISAGFLPQEIRKLFSAHGVIDSLNSKPMHAMLIERRRWVGQMRKAGLSGRQIMDAIKAWYSKDPTRSPFEFLRKEYRPPQKVDRTAYRDAARRRASRMVTGLYRRRKG